MGRRREHGRRATGSASRQARKQQRGRQRGVEEHGWHKTRGKQADLDKRVAESRPDGHVPDGHGHCLHLDSEAVGGDGGGATKKKKKKTHRGKKAGKQSAMSGAQKHRGKQR